MANVHPVVIKINPSSNDFNCEVQELNAVKASNFAAFIGYSSNVTVSGNVDFVATRMPVFDCESDSAWLNVAVGLNEFSDGPFFFGDSCKCVFNNGTLCTAATDSPSPSPSAPAAAPVPVPVPAPALDADQMKHLMWLVVGCTAVLIVVMILSVLTVIGFLRMKKAPSYEMLANAE